MKRWPRRSMTITPDDQDMFPSHLVTKTCFHYTWWPRHVSITPGESNDFQPACQAWPSYRQGDQDILSIALGDLYILSVTPGDQDMIPVNYTIAPGDQDSIPVYRTRWSRHPTFWPRHPTCPSHQVTRTSYLSITPGDQDILLITPMTTTFYDCQSYQVTETFDLFRWSRLSTCLLHQVTKIVYLYVTSGDIDILRICYIMWPRCSTYHTRWHRRFACLSHEVAKTAYLLHKVT